MKLSTGHTKPSWGAPAGSQLLQAWGKTAQPTLGWAAIRSWPLFCPRCTVDTEGDVEDARFVSQPQAPSATLIQTLPNPEFHLPRSWDVSCMPGAPCC